VPFLVRWPGVVPPGTVCDQLVHQADVIATLAEILGTTLPAHAGEDSFSLLPLLRGSTAPVRPTAVSCASTGVPGFREGPWKLVLAADPGASTEVELYDLAADPGETHNLAAAQPARVAAMRAAFEEIIIRGRSNPGPAQPNDVAVRRYPQPVAGKRKSPRVND
jgi:arylsulfatase A-like enzyme